MVANGGGVRGSSPKCFLGFWRLLVFSPGPYVAVSSPRNWDYQALTRGTGPWWLHTYHPFLCGPGGRCDHVLWWPGREEESKKGVAKLSQERCLTLGETSWAKSSSSTKLETTDPISVFSSQDWCKDWMRHHIQKLFVQHKMLVGYYLYSCDLQCQVLKLLSTSPRGFLKFWG